MRVEDGIKDAAGSGYAVKKTIGAVEHGLFVGLTDTLITAGP